MSPEWEKPVKVVLDFFRHDAVTLMGFSPGGGWSFAPPPSSQGCIGQLASTVTSLPLAIATSSRTHPEAEQRR
jgi:hypothetical protein